MRIYLLWCGKVAWDQTQIVPFNRRLFSSFVIFRLLQTRVPNRLSLREYDLNLTALTDCVFLSSVLVDSALVMLVWQLVMSGFSVIWQLMPFSEWISLCGTPLAPWCISKSLPPSCGWVAVRPKRLPDFRVSSSLNLFCNKKFSNWSQVLDCDSKLNCFFQTFRRKQVGMPTQARARLFKVGKARNGQD